MAFLLKLGIVVKPLLVYYTHFYLLSCKHLLATGIHGGEKVCIIDDSWCNICGNYRVQMYLSCCIYSILQCVCEIHYI